jgi:hypothetical protein
MAQTKARLEPDGLLEAPKSILVEPLSVDALVLSLGDWLVSCDELGGLNLLFNRRWLLSGGDIPVEEHGSRASGPPGCEIIANHHAMLFDTGSGTDWAMLDCCLEALSQQAPMPAEAGPEQRITAKRMVEAIIGDAVTAKSDDKESTRNTRAAASAGHCITPHLLA